MSYAGNYIRSKGVDCVVLRNPTIASKVSMKRSTKASRDLGAREGFWEGMMLSEAGLQSGDSFSVGTNTYLVQTVSRDQCSHEDAF
ncbi:MAG: hypothetical protein N2376_01010, partial [Clostridia bacterium]|nr:hypothetical protein [Clostridia bacterium]